MTVPESKPGRVARAIFNYGLGSYLPQLVNFLLVPVYTRFIPPAEMGVLEIALATQLFLTLLMRLGLPGAVSRLYYDVKEGPQLRDLVTTVAFAIVGFSVLLGGLVFAVGPWFFQRFIPDVPFWPYIALAVVSAMLSGAPELQRRLLQARENSAYSARLSAVFGIATTVVNVLLVVGFGMGVRGVLWAAVIVSAAFAVVAWVNHREDLKGHLSRKMMRESVGYGMPLVPHHLAAWVQQNVGRFFLSSAVNAASVGLLSIASRVVSPLAVITGAFANAYSPVYFSWRETLGVAEANREARRVGGAVLVLSAIAVAGAATFGTWVVHHLMAASYAEAATIVGVIGSALHVHLIYTLVGVEIFYAKRTAWVSIIFISAATVNSALVWVLGVRLGALGAALSQLAGGFVSLAIVAVLARKTFPLPLPVRPLITSTFAVTGAAIFPLLAGAGGPGVELVVDLAAFAVLAAVALLPSGIAQQLRADVMSIVGRRLKRSVASPTEAKPDAVTP